MFWTPVAPPVTAPLQPVRPVLRPTVSAQLQGAHLPTWLRPLSLPGPALQALWHSASHVFPARVSVSVCLSVPGCVHTWVPTAVGARGTECVCLCVGFLTFSSRSSIDPTSPASSPSCLLPPFLSHPFFFRPCLVASPLLLLLLLLLLSRFSLFVKTISTHHSFPPPVQLNSLLL